MGAFVILSLRIGINFYAHYNTMLGDSDARIVNDTTVIIAPQSDSACITIEPVDDEIAEGTEFFNLTAIVNNTLDSVNGTTSIEIPANDGMHV
jgi:hypothetical protein